MGKYPTTIVTIDNDDDNLIFKINSDLANYAYKTVGCKNEEFLRRTILKIGNNRFKGQYFHHSTIGSIKNI